MGYALGLLSVFGKEMKVNKAHLAVQAPYKGGDFKTLSKAHRALAKINKTANNKEKFLSTPALYLYIQNKKAGAKLALI